MILKNKSIFVKILQVMTVEDNVLLETFRYRLNDLIRAYEKVSADFENYKQAASLELQRKDEEIRQLNEQISEMDTKYANLKSAMMLMGESGNPQETRNMLNGIVREIDKCIALLNT